MGLENEISGGKPQLTAEKRALLEKRLRGGGIKTPAPRIPRAPQMAKAPLSFAQQRLWFFDNLEPGSPLYNLPSAIRMQGELDVLAVQRALDVIVQRHEALRTRFLNEEGTAIQMIQPPRPAELKVLDLTATAATERETALQELMRAEVTKPFDLTAGYLMRTLLVRTAVNEHVMLVTMHHIISDSWSLTVFFREFAALYGAVKQGREPGLAELPLSYVDYALWQRQEMGGETMAKHWKYWERQLSDAPPLLELPAENSRPAKQSFRGAWVARTLPPALAKDARTLCKQKNVTLFMLMLAVFKVLVFRYTQQPNLVVGSPIAGRTQVETEGLIGFFVNTLVLRTDLSGNPSFSEALSRVRGVTLESFTHQDYPFDKLVEELQPVRSPAYSPLVQLLFALNSEEAQHLKLEGLSISSLPLDTGTSKFDMILTVQEAAGELSLHAEYNVDLFSAASMNRLLGNFQVLLEAVVADPEQRIEEVPLLSREERDLLLKEWSGKKTHYPSGRSLADLFEEQAVRNAGKVALSMGNQTLTYQALNERANSLAHHLLNQGTQRGDMVVIMAERSLETMIAVLAIIKAGAAYVSLEPSTPTERLQGMLQDLKPPVILSQTKFSAKLKEFATATAGASPFISKNVFLDEPSTSIFSGSKANPGLGLTAEDAAYVSFTSGSTGRPKGVRVPHRGVVRLVKTTDYAPFQEDEVFLQMAPIAFDASTLEIWGPLLNGGKLVVFPPHLPNMDELAGFIRQQGITTLWLTAGLFHQLVEHDATCFKGLRRVLAGGDVLSPAHVKQAFEQCEVINGYGPTENTTFTCCHRITDDSLKRKTIPIGRPIANTEVYVLDEHRNLVPIGVAGELFAAGDGLALDYLAAPELTEQKFVRQAIASGPVKRMYRTGD
ncbi:MAG: Glutamate-1-semialdehyde aminotransferase, partial [Verrucomicrobia bacterium]|nr:Glutamate-1-semialdehyde aminotransferase [Verrucomicrobiota bacterium]